MKTISIEIPEGKEAKWVNGVLTLVDEAPQDITERIKTFEDACKWCNMNKKDILTKQFVVIRDAVDNMLVQEDSADILAYLKLRIITCALNEGWKPTFDEGEKRYTCNYEGERVIYAVVFSNTSSRLCFKREELAAYAATQFKDIYMDFCK